VGVDIIKKLGNKRTAAKEGVETVVKEAQLLLEENANSEREALRLTGLDHQIRQVDKKRGAELEREKFEEEYGNETFTKDEIKDICLKYDLRMLNTHKFKGKLDGEVASKLARFCEAHKHEMGGHSDDFHIIAPAKMFELRGEERTPVNITMDPILLYRVPRTGHYVFIHKWGKDFGPWRRLQGMFYNSVESMFFMGWGIGFFMLSMIYAAMNTSFVGNGYQYLHFLWILAGSVGLSLLTTSIIINEVPVNWDKKTTSRLWNEPIKRRST